MTAARPQAEAVSDSQPLAANAAVSSEQAPSPDTGADAFSSDPATDRERAQIQQALQAARGVISKAAAQLGLSRQALYRRMERLGLHLERNYRTETSRFGLDASAEAMHVQRSNQQPQAGSALDRALGAPRGPGRL